MRIPHRRLDRHFVRAVRTSGSTLVSLAAIAGYACNVQLSELLIRGHVAPTPLACARLQAVAQVIGYTGSIFAAKREAA